MCRVSSFMMKNIVYSPANHQGHIRATAMSIAMSNLFNIGMGSTGGVHKDKDTWFDAMVQQGVCTRIKLRGSMHWFNRGCALTRRSPKAGTKQGLSRIGLLYMPNEDTKF